MDPISQGALGAAFAQTTQTREKMVAAAWLGCAAGMAPDLDVFIQSATDPLLFLEFHRHFTHALVFIPVGAAVVAAALYRLVRNQFSFRQAYLVCLVGYATHGLLDACTSYGTQLFWPFSNYRVAWNNVSVVDPAFTLPLLAAVVIACRRRNPRWVHAGIAWALIYLAVGALQLHRATSAAHQLALQRGHEPQRLTMKPSFANLIVWKSIYEHRGRYYVDGIRVLADSRICEGVSVEKLALTKHIPWLDPESQSARDIERFRWFSQDYLAPTGVPGGITDMRYSMVPNEIEPMWGITVATNPAHDAHVTWWSSRDTSDQRMQRFAALFTGEGCHPISARTQKDNF